MSAVLNSLDALVASTQSYGNMPILYVDYVTATTAAASITSGYTTLQRYPNPIVLPSVGAGLTGAVFPYIRMMVGVNTLSNFCGVEYVLGTNTVSSNTFAGGVAMPQKIVSGVNYTTATICPVLYVTAALTATTPVITITYTNQAGTGSRSAALTLPTNAQLNSAFLIGPHLQSGDTGIRSVENISRSTGSAGTLKVGGLLILNSSSGGVGQIVGGPDVLTSPQIPWTVAAGESIVFYKAGSTAASQIMAVLNGVADYN